MIARLLAVVVACAGVTLAGAAVPAPTGDPDADAAKRVADRLAELKGNGATVERIKPFKDILPKHHFFLAFFRQYPVARIVPQPPLKVQNLFAVGPDGKVELITDAKGLETYFKAALPTVKDEKKAKAAGLAWLQLSWQLLQDGFYQFAIVEEATKVADTDDKGKKVTARAVVMRGGNGAIRVEMTFDAKGKLTQASEKHELKPGPRPICQATKLLDADPVVRTMAEQDLLIMGPAAKHYLDEQRAKASPELQKAIDRIWRRILDADR